MPDLEWDTLKDADVRIGWSLAAKSLSRDFFLNMLTVPKIEEASVFDLLVCFIKFQSAGVLEKFVSSSSEYLVLGHLADVVKKTGNPHTNIKVLSAMCAETTEAVLEQKEFAKRWTDGKKAITLELERMSRNFIRWIGDGEVVCR